MTVVVVVAGVALLLRVAGLAGVVTVVLVAVGAEVPASGAAGPASVPARALPAARRKRAATTAACRLRRLRGKKQSKSAPHTASVPGREVLQPRKFFESRYWRSWAWHQSLAKVHAGEKPRTASST